MESLLHYQNINYKLLGSVLINNRGFILYTLYFIHLFLPFFIKIKRLLYLNILTTQPRNPLYTQNILCKLMGIKDYTIFLY